MEVKSNLVIVFHSYPGKPCVDGLMSAIVTATIYNSSNITYVPYWRTIECFETLKTTMTAVGMENTSIIYVDCSPDLDAEVTYLSSIIENVPVHVYDHHPRKEDSPMNLLIGKSNFTFTFDADRCATEMMYAYLTCDQKKQLNADDLVKIIQFSEYEGMNASVAGKNEAMKVADNAFNAAIKHVEEEKKAVDNLQQIRKSGMALFFVLDNILAAKKDWKFLYDNTLNHQEVSKLFRKESSEYLKNAHSVLSGENPLLFSENSTVTYLLLMREMGEKLKTGYTIKSKVGSKESFIYCVDLDIFTFGRSLEPAVRSKLEELGCNYAILMNSPTKNNEGKYSYYFSLRRVNASYDARDLAKFVMEVSGSTIGGGHPWGSGVTLTETQYRVFLDKK